MEKELANRIIKFVETYAGVRPDWDGVTEDEKYTSPDAYELINCANQLKSGFKPTSWWSSWGSGGYHPYTSKEGRKEHEDILSLISIVANS
jgi:hypothetical protein